MQDYRNIILGEAAHGGLPIAYWPLQEVNGTTAADLMATARGTGYSGTYSGSYTLGTGGNIAIDNAVNLTGGNVQIAHNNALTGFSAFTFECWARFTDFSGSFPIVASKGVDLIREFLIYGWTSNAGRLSCEVYDNTGASVRVDANSAITAGTWAHIGLVWASGGTSGLYVNGVSVGSMSPPASRTLRNTGNAMRFGALIDRSYPFNGRIAHAALYGYALTAARLQHHYLAGLNGINPVLRGVGA